MINICKNTGYIQLQNSGCFSLGRFHKALSYTGARNIYQRPKSQNAEKNNLLHDLNKTSFNNKHVKEHKTIVIFVLKHSSIILGCLIGVHLPCDYKSAPNNYLVQETFD